jgi:hypothetical protein
MDVLVGSSLEFSRLSEISDPRQKFPDWATEIFGVGRNFRPVRWKFPVGMEISNLS